MLPSNPHSPNVNFPLIIISLSEISFVPSVTVLVFIIPTSILPAIISLSFISVNDSLIPIVNFCSILTFELISTEAPVSTFIFPCFIFNIPLISISLVSVFPLTELMKGLLILVL